jgi:hypothetical protein
MPGGGQPEDGAPGRSPDGVALPASARPAGRALVVYGGAALGGLLVFVSGVVLVTPAVGLAGGVAFAALLTVQGRRAMRRRGPR